MTRFVFATADEGKIQISIDQQPVGSASTAEELAAIFMQNSVTAGESVYCSSSIDFCEEEGFEPGAAGEMIESALNCFG